MKRHKFIHIINYDLNINYNKSAENIIYNYGSLRKLNYNRNSIVIPTLNYTNLNEYKNDRLSLSTKHISNKNQNMSQLHLQNIHNINNINKIQLFAGLPISITGNINNDLSDNIYCILHRILPNYQTKILSMLKQWNKQDYTLYNLYDFETLIGLIFYKTIPCFFQSKCRLKKAGTNSMDG